MIERHERRDGLDPSLDPVRWERAVASILDAAGPELTRRASKGAGAVRVLEAWARPVFAVAASLVFVGSATVLAVGGESPPRLAEGTGDNTVAEALLPSAVAAWLEVGHELSADDLVTAIEEL